MRRHDGLLGLLSVVLTIAVFIGVMSVLAGAGFAEPDNPLKDVHTKLIPETLEGSGKQTGSVEQEEETEPSEETEPATDPAQPTQPPEETEQATETASTEPTEGTDFGGETPDNGDGGSNDSGEENDGPDGEDGTGSTVGGDTSGESGDDTVKIVTDLRSCQLSRTELPSGALEFYAYPSREDGSFTVKAVMKNSSTSANGQTLSTADGIHYVANLVLNETTTITLYLKDHGENVSYVRYQIRYEAEKADDDNPEVGENPPSIVTNLDGFTGVMETQDFLLWVSARTNPGGEPIYSNQIEVWLNGELVPKQTGDARPEYELHFQPPNVGDTARYTVKVRAWDGRGNSALKTYVFDYHTVSEGDALGSVRLVLDATTVGLAILDSATYDIVQGDTAAGVVIRFLEDYGYDAVYDGNATIGFYLRRIGRGGMCGAAAVPEHLWDMILRDGIQISGNSSYDSLGEYDYTMGSGWMYSINGSIYPGRGLSEYRLSSDTTIYLRFTLAYGKDIGGYDATGQGYGSLSGYCGIWTGGGYTPLSHTMEETDRMEATETTDGYVEYTCSRCGEVQRDVIPMLGDATQPPETTQPPEIPEPTPEPTDPPEDGTPSAGRRRKDETQYH